jgi:hypothetical protein
MNGAYDTEARLCLELADQKRENQRIRADLRSAREALAAAVECRWRQFPTERPPLPTPAGQTEGYLVTTKEGRVCQAVYTSTGAWTQGGFGHPRVMAWMPYPKPARASQPPVEPKP